MSLIELLVAITILAILTAMAMPSFLEYVANNRVTAANNGLVTALTLARSEALRRGQTTAVCISENGTSCVGSGHDWARGWIAFIDTDGDGLLSNADATVDTDGSGRSQCQRCAAAGMAGARREHRRAHGPGRHLPSALRRDGE